MRKILNWIKTHKLASVLLLILTLIFAKNIFSNLFSYQINNQYTSRGMYESDFALVGAPAESSMLAKSLPSIDEAPPTTNQTRMVVQNSYLSLVVENVPKTAQTITDYATSVGGYMVSSNISTPEEGGTGTVVIRVPSDKLKETREMLKTNSVKVVNENLEGTDVTDQYEDINTKLAILERNKLRFEELMAKATEISDILSIQQEIFSLQSQIDSFKGRQEYLEKTAQMAMLTVYLSTDEYALPYTPPAVWKPGTVFKEAVRALVLILYRILSIIIWIFVFGIIWAPILVVALIAWYLMRRKKRTQTPLA